MANIIARKRADGTTGYTANIRLKRGGVIVHRESQTFDREQAAKAWAKKREAELSLPGALDKPEDPTLADVIDKYNKDKIKEHGKTKTQVLRSIRESDLGKMRCSQIKSHHIVEYAKGFITTPQTTANYISHLASVFTVARPAWGYPLDKTAMDDARIVLTRLGLVTRSRQRSRRPTLGELDQLLEYFTTIAKKRPSSIPMTVLIPFAIFSTRRQEEITRMTWKDFFPDTSEIIVRDMKNPGEKIGNDVRTVLTPEALAIIQAFKPRGERIFPFNAASVSSAFTRACQLLGIEDLHFHDLRHEGISRLFELGWNIPRVASVSGHRSWASLKRYTHLREEGDKYANWPWYKKITTKT